MKVNTSEVAARGMKISDFQTKDVINITDGKRLGQISDLELDLKQGRIEAIVVPGYSRFMGLLAGDRSGDSLEKYRKDWFRCDFGEDG